MSNKYTKYFISGIVLLLIVFGLLHTIGTSYFSRKINSPDNPDGIMENVTVIETGVDGYPTDRLISPKLVNYKLNNVTLLTTPHFTIYSPPGPPWEITSDHGRATGGITEVYLWENVIVKQPGTKLHPPSTMTTEHFTFFPKTKQGHTDAPVKLTQPGIVITAIGADADLVKQKITLLSQAQGVYSNGITKGNE